MAKDKALWEERHCKFLALIRISTFPRANKVNGLKFRLSIS